ATDPEDGAPGLYVTVHDGHVILENDAGRVDLGRLESGYTPSSTEEPKRTQCCTPIVDFEHFQPLGCASP
ncbi:MAG: hypothetical protein GY731_16400, partial [Gammaproteobacteria bacterium]|nr:hypothetical protein [Gammaproteobacteria bacterium]